MSLDRNKKQEIVSLIKNNIENALSIIVVNFSEAKSNQMNELRKLCRKLNISLIVVRNKLLKLAIQNTSIEHLKNHFIGQNIISFSNENPQDVARFFKNFSIKNNEFIISFGICNGKCLSKNDIDLLASLPSYKESVIQLIRIMKNISVGKLIHTLSIVKNQS